MVLMVIFDHSFQCGGGISSSSLAPSCIDGSTLEVAAAPGGTARVLWKREHEI